MQIAKKLVVKFITGDKKMLTKFSDISVTVDEFLDGM
jgi:hypothetical protein